MVPSRIGVFDFKPEPAEGLFTSELRRLVDEALSNCKFGRNFSFDVSKSFEEFVQNLNLCLTSSLEKGFVDRDERPFTSSKIQSGSFKSCTLYRLMEIRFDERDVVMGVGKPFGYFETRKRAFLVEMALENGVKKAIDIGEEWLRNGETPLLDKVGKMVRLCREWQAVSEGEKRERVWRFIEGPFFIHCDLKTTEKIVVNRIEETDRSWDKAYLARRLRGITEDAIRTVFQDAELFDQVKGARFKRSFDCWKKDGQEVEEEVKKKLEELFQPDVSQELSMGEVSKSLSFTETPWESLEKKWIDVSEKVRELWKQFPSDLDKIFGKKLEERVAHHCFDENFLSKESLVPLIKESLLLSCQDLTNHDSVEVSMEVREGK